LRRRSGHGHLWACRVIGDVRSWLPLPSVELAILRAFGENRTEAEGIRLGVAPGLGRKAAERQVELPITCGRRRSADTAK
jgi:hypothetical protein